MTDPRSSKYGKGWSQKANSANQRIRSDRYSKRQSGKQKMRRMLTEQLEARQLLATAPQLIGIQPNNSELLTSGAVRNTAPNELVFRFDDVQRIDPSTLAGIRLTAAGGDGRLGVATAESDFGSNGRASIQLTSEVPGQNWTVSVNHSSMAVGMPPTLMVSGSTVTITLNTNINSRTTASGLLQAINNSPLLSNRLTARLKGGLETATLGHLEASTYSPIRVQGTNDRMITPGTVLVGSSPNENEVTMRFAEALKDDLYRIEIFGFDDPARSIVGLRNVGTSGAGSGDLFRPTQEGTRQDTIDFRLDLGPQVTAVVPQPVVREGTQLRQRRNEIVVYFDSDKLLVENGSDNKPTSRSVENPAFYQLIFTRDTVRNTDDTYFQPQSVRYNALTNTATLLFASDLTDLAGGVGGNVTYRLRIGTRETQPISPSRQNATEVGSTFDTSMNLGTVGSASIAQTSLILSGAIDPKPLLLDLLGASSDPGHRQLLQGNIDNLEDHINSNFGGDVIDGAKTIYYNFRSQYAQELGGSALTNAINDQQKNRAREVLSLWSKYIGVQFVETNDLGLTLAVGQFSSLNVVPSTQLVTMPSIQTGVAPNVTLAETGRVRVDPTFNDSLIVLSATTNWGNQYGESFSRVMAASVGLALGLTNGGDLASTELMKFDPIFLAGNDSLIDSNDAQLNANDERYEPVFPGNQDILHAQYIHRPDSTDIDFYRFEIDLGSGGRLGNFVAETYAQRLADSSELDTHLQLYREVNARGQTTFNVGDVLVEFESLRPGAIGNQFQVFFTQSQLGPGALPQILVSDNGVSINLNSSDGSQTTVQQILDVIADSASASQLVKARLISGSAATRVGGNQLTQNPIRLLGGRFELIAQNEDYFSRDSLIRQKLGSGVYYVGVSASGNNQYNGSVQDSGFGGRTQGKYELRLNFRSEVDQGDTIQDLSGQFSGDRVVGLDGNLDGTPGGTYDFWFQTRPLNRTLKFSAGGSAALEGRTLTVVGANGTTRVFEFSSDGNIGPGRFRIAYTNSTTATALAQEVARVINSQDAALGITASANEFGAMTLSGERSITLDAQLQQLSVISVGNRMIFVDKAASPNSDGSLAKPFNNISGAGVANAFAAALPGDIVRIVANGGSDNNLATIENNFAYEIGRGLLAGSTLSDGLTMDIPKGVVTMVDAGAVFKLRQAVIQAGSSNLNIDRNGAVLQVLGAPILLDAAGNAMRKADGVLAGGQVYFTSWLDERIGLDNYTPTTTPTSGDWGGIMLRRDVDRSAGRSDLEDEGIFLRNINYADIRYGGGIVNIDSVQQIISPIHILANRPAITNNSIRFASSAAISADPNALEESNFNEPRYQASGAFTSDYDRVGPTVHGNRLADNSINGLFISVETPADGTPRILTVPARLNDTDVVHVLTENLVIAGAVGGAFLDNAQANPVKTPRLSASLVIDPGMVIKFEAARIEAQMGANIIAEGVDGRPIYFTSRLDDTIGAGGTFDTNNNGSQSAPRAGDWGGIYVAPTSKLSLDHGRLSYGGGVTRLEGTFKAFNTIEIQQADARIANSTFSNNATGVGGQGPGTRHGRLSNSPATIFVRGSQPTIIGNTFEDNAGSMIRIDVNSLTDKIVRDDGRQTGAAERDVNFIANRGPLVRNNRAVGNGLNGMEIRGGTLTVGSVWDDTDIVHVVGGPIFTGNIQHSGGLRLQSSPTESLVVKFNGYGSNFNRNLGAGITANGQLTTATDRVGGTLHVLGQPGFPVVLTSLKDDTVGAGQRPDGAPQTDTNNDGIGSIPQAADWRGILVDQYANDRNVAIVMESESPRAAAPGLNASTGTAQVLGDLAASGASGNENLRLGFVVEGVLGQPEDVDVFSFTGVAGSEVWLDVDYTRNDMDMILELLDAQGNLLARSTSSTLESEGQSAIFTSSMIASSYVAPLNSRPALNKTNASGLIKEDGTTNVKDPGLRVRLPGAAGARNTFYFRLRSRGLDIAEVGTGLSAGAYQVQVRLREAQEWAGSTVNYADIRYAMNGVHLRGMPGESPLIGEAMEDESVGNGSTTANNGVGTASGRLPPTGSSSPVDLDGRPFIGSIEVGRRPQFLGNILDTAKGAISLAGNLSNQHDLDFYVLDISQEDLVGDVNSGFFAPIVFDIDYSDGLNRPDISLNIFQEEVSTYRYNPAIIQNYFDPQTQYRLIYTSSGGHVADDQPRPFLGNDMQDLSRGSGGTKDPFIGPIALAEGRYLVAISSTALSPRALSIDGIALRPINSIRRIVDEGYAPGVTTAAPPIVTNFLPSRQIGVSGEILSQVFNLGAYSQSDQPAIYLDYTRTTGNFQVLIRNSAGTDTLVASSTPALGQISLPMGPQSVKIPLTSANWDYAGQDDLRLILRSNNPLLTVNDLVIGFNERGEQVGGVTDELPLLDSAILFGANVVESTREFSLVGYDALIDAPALDLNYEVNNGELDIFMVDRFGISTLLATTNGQDATPVGVFQLVVSDANLFDPSALMLDLSRWANQPGLRIEFRTRDGADSQSIIRNVHLQMRDGTRVATGEPNASFQRVTPALGTITTGNYQLEVRIGDNFFQSRSLGQPLMTKTFDTNDRLANGVSIVAPNGIDITSGDQFLITERGVEVTFEFTQSGTVTGVGNIPVRFNPADANFVVAKAIRDAINSSAVQARFQVKAATSSGIAIGTAGRDPRLNLFGEATVRTLAATNPAGEVQVIYTQGRSDRNVTRQQGQVLVQNSFIRQSRDYGVWSEPAARAADPRDQLENSPLTSNLSSMMQSKPNLVGTQAIRHLPTNNESVLGGFMPGVIVQNNVLEEGGLGGINISGENPIWMLSPILIPSSDNSPLSNSADPMSHFGGFFNDTDALIIDSDRTRVRLEFDDMASPAGGNGVEQASSPLWFRDTGGDFYFRLTCNSCQPFASNALETMHAIRDGILGSILVTNGTTQIVKPTVAESLMGPVASAPLAPSVGYPNYFNRPAVFIEGVSDVSFFNTQFTSTPRPLDIRTLDLGLAPQPNAKVVNNTIIGRDGRANFNGETPLNEPNDTLADAVETWQGTGSNPVKYVAQGTIGPSTSGLTPNSDADLFQFKLGLGERAVINVDTPESELQAAIRIFDSQGVPQTFKNHLGQSVLVTGNEGPGETWIGRDPVADFTALKPGVYYAAVSSVGNTNYDPLSSAGRKPGTSSGAYQITIDARTLQDFVIVAQDASAYTSGQTFTIHGVADHPLAGVTGNATGATFEFVIGPGPASSPTNIPINLSSDWRFPDVARAIAKAINEGLLGQPAIPNTQQLPNGNLGFANPLPAVYARALGGLSGVLDAPLNRVPGDLDELLFQLSSVDEMGSNALTKREIENALVGPVTEVNQGLKLFPRRTDGFTVFSIPGQFAQFGVDNSYQAIWSISHLGIGHDRRATTPISPTSIGDGTTEKFVVVRNAASVESNGSILVSPDTGSNHNLNQLLPETGILSTRGASPNLMNNVFFNVQTPVVNEESRKFPIGGDPFHAGRPPAPFGSNNPITLPKPGQVILSGSIYQYSETVSPAQRFFTGIETSPTNVPNTGSDFNLTVPGSTRLFVNAQAGNYLPAPSSPLIDSAIDSLPERTGLASVKSSVGLPVSPVLAPALDIFGQLRTDDPAVAPPQGQGQNVFKDRGALDRSDFIGPAAILLNPIDNDAAGVDQDSADAVVQLVSGVYPEFRIQLKDGFEPGNALAGLGIDDSSVTGGTIEGLRAPGAAVVLLENGRMLTEGIDYSFAYNTTSDEIILTPLAGVWKSGNVYEIVINNRDRFVVSSPAGHQISDGDTFSIVDENGGVVVFEFESAYRLQVPQSLSLLVPLAGAAFGGVNDGQRLTITSANRVQTTFEFDSNSNFLAGNRAVPIAVGASQGEVVTALISAINSAALGVTATDAGEGRINLGAQSGVRLNTTDTVIDQPRGTLAFEIPANALRGILRDGQSFSLNNGRRTINFEFDSDGVVASGNVSIDFSAAESLRALATLMQQAIASSPLGIVPSIVADDLLYIGLPEGGSVDAGTSPLTVVGTSRTLRDGQFFSISHQGLSRTFEFTTDAAFTAGRVPISITANDSQNQIASRIVQAIRSTDLGLTPTLAGAGNIVIGGDETTLIDISGATDLGLFGRPGIRSSTRLDLFGPLFVQVPVVGASGIADNSTFLLTHNGRTEVFEFDNNFSGPSQSGNVLVRYNNTNTAAEIAQLITNAILTTNLGLAPQTLGGGRINLGRVPDSVFPRISNFSSLTTSRGLVEDGERFTISIGSTSVTFEFDDVSLNNGVASGNRPILFGPNSSKRDIVDGMQAAINAAGLGLNSTILPGDILQLNDTARHSINTGLAPTLVRTGIPGGANQVSYIPDASFTSEDMKRALINAINASIDNTLQASDRGGGTLLVSGAVSISPELDNFFLRGVVDPAGNFLKSNQLDDETRFTVLMPGVELDFGDAPDPLSTTLGRYPTLFVNDGARHLISDRALLGSLISAEPNGQPSSDASADSNDDGVAFGTNYQIAGLFNSNFDTQVTVTLSSPGFVDGWIDWNSDGDWDDPGEYVTQSVAFSAESLTKTFQIRVPASAPALNQLTASVARFRSSTRGSLATTGLAVDGEVEDYRVFIAPGSPPEARNDQYQVSEDGVLTTTDATGLDTVGFSGDDGVLANDSDPDTQLLAATLITGPANAAQFVLNANGTFLYRPQPNFFGTDNFVYRANDGLLNANHLATVTITVTEINDAPSAVNELLHSDEDQTLIINQSALIVNDSAGPNEAGQTLTVTSVQTTSQQGGTVSLSGGEIRYTPPANFFGTDTFTYTITDSGTTAGSANPLSATGTVTVQVREVNDPPIPGSRTDQMHENRPTANSVLQFSAQDLVNAAQPGPVEERSWQSVRFVGVWANSVQGGTVTWDSATNLIRFVPSLHFAGADTFTYQVEDFSTDPQRPIVSSRSTGTVTVNIANINDAPFVQTAMGTRQVLEDAAASLIDLGSVFGDRDIAVAGDELTFRVVSQTNESLVQASVVGSSLRIEPQQDKNGQTSVVVEATDKAGLTVRDTLSLTVTPVNDAPRLVNPFPTINANKNTVIPGITLSPNHFFDPDVQSNGDVLSFQIVGNSNPSMVSATVESGVLKLTLLPNQFGTGSVVIQATDSTNQSATGAVTLTISNLNEPPVGLPDGYRVPQGSLLNVSAVQGVLANDTDAENSPLTAILVSAPQQAAQFNLNSNGSFSYQHNGTSRQSDSFTYRASDGLLQSQLVTVTITVDAPLPSTHQNRSNNLDVNADGRVSAIDALLIINLLNSMPAPIRVESLGAPPPYYDVNGDYRVSSFDALLVINELNRRSGGGGSGEAEGEGQVVDSRQLAPAVIDVSASLDNRRYQLLPVSETTDRSQLLGKTVKNTSVVSASTAGHSDWIEERASQLPAQKLQEIALTEVLAEELDCQFFES